SSKKIEKMKGSLELLQSKLSDLNNVVQGITLPRSNTIAESKQAANDLDSSLNHALSTISQLSGQSAQAGNLNVDTSTYLAALKAQGLSDEDAQKALKTILPLVEKQAQEQVQTQTKQQKDAIITSIADDLHNAAVAGGKIKAASKALDNIEQMQGLLVELKSATSGLSGALAQMSQSTNSQIDELTSQLNQIQTAVSASANGASQINSGAARLNSGAGQLASGLQAGVAGSSQLANGAGQLANGASQLNTGLQSGLNGTNQLANGIVQLNSGAGQLSSGIGQLNGGANQLANGAGQIASNNPKITAG